MDLAETRYDIAAGHPDMLDFDVRSHKVRHNQDTSKTFRPPCRVWVFDTILSILHHIITIYKAWMEVGLVVVASSDSLT